MGDAKAFFNVYYWILPFSIVFLITLSAEAYNLFAFGIFPHNFTFADNSTNESFSSNFSSLWNTTEIKILFISVFINRSFVIILIFFIFNILILIFIVISANTRRKITGGGKGASQSSKSDFSAKKKRMIMIICTGLNYFLGHILISINYFMSLGIGEEMFNNNINKIGFVIMLT